MDIDTILIETNKVKTKLAHLASKIEKDILAEEEKESLPKIIKESKKKIKELHDSIGAYFRLGIDPNYEDLLKALQFHYVLPQEPIYKWHTKYIPKEYNEEVEYDYVYKENKELLRGIELCSKPLRNIQNGDEVKGARKHKDLLLLSTGEFLIADTQYFWDSKTNNFKRLSFSKASLEQVFKQFTFDEVSNSLLSKIKRYLNDLPLAIDYIIAISNKEVVLNLLQME